LRDAIRDQHIQLEELRGIVSKPIVIENTREIIREEKIPISIPLSAPVVPLIQKVRQSAVKSMPSKVDPFVNKWNSLVLEPPKISSQQVDTITVLPHKKSETLSVVEEKIEPNTKLLVPLLSVTEQLSPQLEPDTTPIAAEPVNSSEVLADTLPEVLKNNNITIRFYSGSNRCLRERGLTELHVVINASDIDDDIIVAIRRSLSVQVSNCRDFLDLIS
jgi:hypothetical protein